MYSIPLPICLEPVLVTALLESVRAGFPSPAEDLGASRIDVLAHLILHPAATYSMTVEFVCKFLYKRAGVIRLKAGNPTYPDIIPKDGQLLEIWGVVLTSLKRFKA